MLLGIRLQLQRCILKREIIPVRSSFTCSWNVSIDVVGMVLIDAAEACLAAIIARGRLSPYVTLLDHIFLKWSPAALSASDYHRMRHWSNRPTTDQAQELESAVRLLQLSQPAKEALVNILKRQEEREEEVLRDVRSL